MNKLNFKMKEVNEEIEKKRLALQIKDSPKKTDKERMLRPKLMFPDYQSPDSSTYRTEIKEDPNYKPPETLGPDEDSFNTKMTRKILRKEKDFIKRDFK